MMKRVWKVGVYDVARSYRSPIEVQVAARTVTEALDRAYAYAWKTSRWERKDCGAWFVERLSINVFV